MKKIKPPNIQSRGKWLKKLAVLNLCFKHLNMQLFKLIQLK